MGSSIQRERITNTDPQFHSPRNPNMLPIPKIASTAIVK